MTHQRGFTLVEMLGVIAFVALATAAMWRYLPGLNRSRDESMLISNIVLLQDEIREIYAGQLDYTGITVNDVVSRGETPPGITDRAAGTLITPWGDQINVTPTSLAGDIGGSATAAVLLRISVASLSDTGKAVLCRSLMPRLAAQFDTINIGGRTVGQQVVVGGVDLPNAALRAEIETSCSGSLLSDPWMGGVFQ